MTACRSRFATLSHQRLIDVFERTFFVTYNTRLVGGADEPLYVPATPNQPAMIYFRHDFAASALHEAAHWCIAGARRRQLQDYGYWYEPDGRDEEKQKAFEQVEVLPQALECVFASASGLNFRVSADNLDGEGGGASAQFIADVFAAVDRLLDKELRSSKFARAQLFFNALMMESGLEAKQIHIAIMQAQHLHKIGPNFIETA